MRPRSVVFDLFGDYLRYSGGTVGLQPLTDLLQPFGVTRESVRVVLSRLRREGWFEARRHGRVSAYSMTAQLWELLDEGLDRIFGRPDGPWSGSWYTVIYTIPERSRSDRDHARQRLAWLGFGPLAPSVWVCPHDRLDAASREIRDVEGGRLDLLVSQSRGREHDMDIVRRCWDLDALQEDYCRFLERWEHRSGVLEAQGPDALVARVELVHDYRKFPFRDPGLPTDLLPSDWAGHAAYGVFLSTREALRASAEQFVADVLARYPGVRAVGASA